MLRDDVIILTAIEAVDLECTWQYLLTEFRPKQTKAVCVNRVDLSLWASMAVSMIMSFT